MRRKVLENLTILRACLPVSIMRLLQLPTDIIKADKYKEKLGYQREMLVAGINLRDVLNERIAQWQATFGPRVNICPWMFWNLLDIRCISLKMRLLNFWFQAVHMAFFVNPQGDLENMLFFNLHLFSLEQGQVQFCWGNEAPPFMGQVLEVDPEVRGAHFSDREEYSLIKHLLPHIGNMPLYEAPAWPLGERPSKSEMKLMPVEWLSTPLHYPSIWSVDAARQWIAYNKLFGVLSGGVFGSKFSMRMADMLSGDSEVESNVSLDEWITFIWQPEDEVEGVDEWSLIHFNEEWTGPKIQQRSQELLSRFENSPWDSIMVGVELPITTFGDDLPCVQRNIPGLPLNVHTRIVLPYEVLAQHRPSRHWVGCYWYTDTNENMGDFKG